MKKNTRWWINKIGIALAIVLLSSIGFFVALYIFTGLLVVGFFDRSGYESFTGIACTKSGKQREEERLNQYFGVPFPDGGVVVTSCFEHLSVFGEGSSYIVLSVTAEDLRNIRETATVIDGLPSEGWKAGPVPSTVQENTILDIAFAKDFDSENLEYLFMSDQTTSVLIVVDYERNKAFFSKAVFNNP